MTLDPQLAPLIETLDAGFPPVHTMTGAQARAIIKSRFARPLDPEQVAEVRDTTVPGPGGDIPVRIYRPAGDAPLPVLIYAHGGGFVFCDLDSHDGLCRDLANRSPAVVISVDYRLAPEHPWPAAAEDMYAVTQWAAEYSASLGGDAQRIVVGGDSAGGNLAAVTALRAREAGPPIRAQLLIYPVTDHHSVQRPSYTERGTGFGLTRDTMMWFWDQYLAAAEDGAHPDASPIRATSLAGLPPACVVTAGFDLLRDEGDEYAARLQAAGVPVAHLRYADMNHGFLNWVGLVDRSTEAMDAVCAWLRQTLG